MFLVQTGMFLYVYVIMPFSNFIVLVLWIVLMKETFIIVFIIDMDVVVVSVTLELFSL